MRRRTFIRRLRSGFAAVALVLAAALALAAAGLWVRSYWVSDAVGVNRQAPGASSQYLWSARGQLALVRWHLPAASRTQFTPVGWYYRSRPVAGVGQGRFVDGAYGVRRFAGVAYLDYTYPLGPVLAGMRERGLRVPYWMVVAVLGAWPAARVVSHGWRRRRARAAAGLCPQCGYDLRATPQQCPECGATPGGGGNE